jgi:MOSC domain-containing protein YiiM
MVGVARQGGGVILLRSNSLEPYPPAMHGGRIHRINISTGGVPKLPVERAAVTVEGLAGDGHDDKRHGGPNAAVCLFSLEVIERLRAEGHPIGPGTTGENVTVAGLDWRAVVPGSRLVFEGGGGEGGGVELEVVQYTSPCSTIRDSFTGLEFRRIKQELHPGESRVYARVIRGGELKVGAAVSLVGAAGRA